MEVVLFYFLKEESTTLFSRIFTIDFINTKKSLADVIYIYILLKRFSIWFIICGIAGFSLFPHDKLY